eukprot:153549-Chlamydomonas_euryale.AAC.1
MLDPIVWGSARLGQAEGDWACQASLSLQGYRGCRPDPPPESPTPGSSASNRCAHGHPSSRSGVIESQRRHGLFGACDRALRHSWAEPGARGRARRRARGACPPRRALSDKAAHAADPPRRAAAAVAAAAATAATAAVVTVAVARAS